MPPVRRPCWCQHDNVDLQGSFAKKTRTILQGYLPRSSETPDHLEPPYDPRYATVGSEGEAVSYERGTPVQLPVASPVAGLMPPVRRPCWCQHDSLNLQGLQGYLAHKNQSLPL